MCNSNNNGNVAYVVDSLDNTVKIYSMFAGMGLPTTRIDQLKLDTKELQSKIKIKDDQVNLQRWYNAVSARPSASA